MSQAESPGPTEAQQILATQDEILVLLRKLVDAVNNLGMNQQWIVDNTQGIFQFFNSPQFAAMLQQVMTGQMPMMGMPIPGAIQEGTDG